MTEPIFVNFEQVLRAHAKSLEAFGGSKGIRDPGLLSGAVDQPLNDYYYAGADLLGIAAAYAFHIGQAQAFLDGNKRTAVAVALAFLEQNGVQTNPNTARLYDAMIGIAERRLTKSDLAEEFRALFRS
ncbi:MAG: type II toxin-antitoxin system death-on-curing family toxin [Verrucomicrobiota bacterium]|nr:type II toxin-antitoxin system death-on-curing family toxin [Verrucomicrobiota bacterium]